MFGNFSLRQAAEYVAERDRVQDDIVTASLDDNSTEIKAIVQAPLVVGETMTIGDITNELMQVCKDTDLNPLSSAQVGRTLLWMEDAFVRTETTPKGRAATQTKVGRYVSASVGGHLLKLSIDTGVSLRALMGEPRKAEGGDEPVTTNATENRLTILSTLWTLARDNWQPSPDLTKILGDASVPGETARVHLRKLAIAGILEKEERVVNTKARGPRKMNFYRLGQDGDTPPVEIVERYLAIVTLSSALSPDFVGEGLANLYGIAGDGESVSDLITKARNSYKGKPRPSYKRSIAA